MTRRFVGLLNLRIDQLDFKITSNEELRSVGFWWRCAFMFLWFVAVVIVSNQFEELSIYIFFLAPLASLVLGRIKPGTPADFQGMLFVGTAVSSLVAPGIISTLEYRAAHYSFADRIVGVSELCVFIVLSLPIGFFLVRYLCKRAPP